VPRAQSLQLFDQPAIEHRIEPRLDAPVQLAAIGGHQSHLDEAEGKVESFLRPSSLDIGSPLTRWISSAR